jgi:hypothetical protein
MLRPWLATNTNSFGQPIPGGQTTLYTLDAASDSLLIQAPANAGTQTLVAGLTLGANPLDFSNVNGFDIDSRVIVNPTDSPAPADSLAVAALTVAGATGLYSVDLTTGASTLLGTPLVDLIGLAIGR